MPRWDAVWTGANLATMVVGGAPYGAVRDGAIAIRDGRIAWLGPRAALPHHEAVESVDAGGRWITPGLIDCHTHLVFGGDRAGEFELRLQGATYEEIARRGGGIRSTVASTRAASDATLLAAAQSRLQRLMAEGVTTIEIKSGYGLERDSEIKMLRVARRLGELHAVSVVTAFLGAHAVPPEYDGRQGDYVDLVIDDMLPAVADARLADAVDVFIERIGFTGDETARILAAAGRRGLPVKLHADQLSDQGGAALAARFKALSADHLEYANDAGLAAMAAAGTVAVLLPGAFYFLRETRLPSIAAMRRAGVRMALASDCNPGSSPAVSLLLMLNLACTLFRLTPEEALAGITRHAAAALGLAGDRGTLETGKIADFVAWDIAHPAELSYWLGANPAAWIVRGGKIRR
ncbi:MAG: imidazolonepropionase [Proteobacteria bacterium]|nr:imidazolonepropionase [Pseudomonadota bacterium]